MNSSSGNVPPLSRLRPFEAAARHESFSIAATELGMTQTAVSKQIGLFEKELGLLLFERRNRAVFLTDAGRRLGQVVGSALNDIASEIAVLKGNRRSSELILQCQLCEAFYWLMPRLARFHELHPGVELRVFSSLTPLAETAESYDVAIQTSGRAIGTAKLAFTAPDEIFPVCSPSLMSEERLPLKLETLATFPLLSHSVIPQDWMDWYDWFECIGEPNLKNVRTVSFNSYPLALQAAVAGQGIALGWRRATEDLIAEGKLVKPCEQFVTRPTELSVFRGSTLHPHPKVEQLLSWLAAELTR